MEHVKILMLLIIILIILAKVYIDIYNIKILKEIKNSPFKPLIKKYYLGKLRYGSPYFYPMYFVPTIIHITKLKLRSQDELQELYKRYPHLKKSDHTKFKNMPMVRRSKSYIKKIFNHYYYIEIGYPIKFHTNQLGWKDKYGTPRFEWTPAFYLYFLKWQFCIWWKSPTEDEDNYWEMFLWWKNYSDKDIIKAEKTWGWADFNTKKSTWDKNNLK